MNINQHTKILNLFLLIIGTYLLSGCTRNQNIIPNVYVDTSININNPSYIDINNVSGWMYLDGGSQGLIIYRATLTGFMVYDRHSPFEPYNDCQVSVDSSTLEVLDNCSDSKFSIYDGSVTNGPAALPLKQYQTAFDGANLRIYN